MAKKHDGDDLLDIMISQQKKVGAKTDGGGMTYMARDAELLWTGVELPCLALKWLFDSNVLPLGHIFGLAGPPESQKSSLALEIARWILGADGRISYLDCEGGKVSDSLMKSLLSGDQLERMAISVCPTIDIAQEQINTVFAGLKLIHEKKNIKPLWCILVDSLTGAPTGAYSNKVNREGHDVATFGDMAKSWTGYLRKLSGDLVGKPVVFCFVNHQKEAPPAFPGAMSQKTTPGGKGQEYHASAYFWVKKVSLKDKQKSETGEDTLRRLQLTSRKSSIGTDNRKIFVDFYWYYDENNKQVSTFKWALADAEFLTSVQKYPGVADLCPVRVYDGLYTAEKLGLTKVIGEEVGAAVKADPKLVADLEAALHIKQHKVYTGTWDL